MLTKREVSKASPDLKEMRRLYNASFPDDERIAFRRLLKELSPERKMYAYYEGEELVGLSYLFFHEDLVYLSYICIEESLRDKGYGSEVLQIILEDLKDHRIALDIEEVKEGTENEEERKRRKAFYLRNGFVSSGVFYRIYHVDYEILCAHGEVKKEDWHALIRKHWGSFADTAVYY
ncbi:MAG: GNAT family N-acetyltransferase [Erysipelotrichaceae bacterium]|nr:GNAT family N-acetyltransferase [Erysipelotrichaceae bacterium]